MKTKAKNVIHSAGHNALSTQGVGAVNIRTAAKRKTGMEYPAGSVGADLMRRGYIRYLTERYFRYREANASFGLNPARRFSYAVLFETIETHFKAPTYFIPIARFDELVDFLQGKIERTVLGKRNRSRGYPNYETFDEFQLPQAGE